MQSSPESDLWQRVKNVLHQLSEAPVEERSALLEKSCEGDPKLLREVLSFLDLEEEAETFIDTPLWRAVVDGAGIADGFGDALDSARGDSEKGDFEKGGAEPPEHRLEDALPIDRLGPYRFESKLGQGGMGEVYLAVREDDYEQKVAIKRTLDPMLSEQTRQRFVNERQILANLQHPGIARLLDGGADEGGRPYLVMEYVEGAQIDRYCEESGLTIRQRLRLVSKVCRIVHFAHQNLVVHRDLKPSNILVTEDGQPRLLDFGIAKLLDRDAALTAKGVAALTPACASPEQIMGERVTTACDVYALGVLLYRLLAGTAPYDLEGLSFAEVRRIVCLQKVEKPSVRAAATHRRDRRHPDSVIIPASDLVGLKEERPSRRPRGRTRRQVLEGDLDAIILKAMRKEPEHRYGSAAELAEDIDRYLEGLPVTARRGNWFYHAGKHMRRNKPIVALMAAILVLAVIALVLAFQAETARRSAVESRDASIVLKDFLIDILESPHPDKDKGRYRSVREVVEEAVPKTKELASRPLLHSEMLSILGRVFNQLGDNERALELYQEALVASVEGEPRPCSVQAERMANVGSAHYYLRHYAQAEQHFERALELRQECGDAPLLIATTLYNLANARNWQGQATGVTEAYTQVLELRRHHGAPPGSIASSHYSLGAWFLKSGETEKAIEHLEEAMELRRQVDGELSTGLASLSKSLARAYHAAGRHDEADALYRESLRLHTHLYGAEDQRTVKIRPLYIRLLLDLERLDEAVALTRTNLALARDAFDAASPDLVAAESVWGACLLRLGRAAEAEPLLLEGYRVLAERHGGESFPARWTRAELERLP